MPLLTDDEAKELANECPPHKIILDGPGLGALIDSACRVAYQAEDTIVEDEECHKLAYEIGMAMHEAEKTLEPLLKALVFRVAKLEYGG